MIYVYIAAFGFFSIIFLTIRDIRIFRRTKIEAYRKGALRGMLAGALALVGLNVTAMYPNPSVGLTITLVAVYLNGKGKREDVFGDAPLIKRVLGETTVQKNIERR
jgi:hypothetical protein